MYCAVFKKKGNRLPFTVALADWTMNSFRKRNIYTNRRNIFLLLFSVLLCSLVYFAFLGTSAASTADSNRVGARIQHLRSLQRSSLDAAEAKIPDRDSEYDEDQEIIQEVIREGRGERESPGQREEWSDHRHDRLNLYNLDRREDRTSTPTVKLRFDGIPGTLRLRLRPDWSKDSLEFWQTAGQVGRAGSLYRNEAPALIQGRIDMDSVAPLTAIAKGSCPPGAIIDPRRSCPPHDPSCACHGPIMRRGMVAWAGGGTGPDWFIYTGEGPAKHWSHDHTVFAEVVGDESWAVLRTLQAQPSKSEGGMKMLKSPITFLVSKK